MKAHIVLCIALVGGTLSCGRPVESENSNAGPSRAQHTEAMRTWHGAPPHGIGPFTVSNARVIDGDSLDVSIAGARVAVRLLGVDAPEGNTACGRAATAQLEQLVARGLTLTDDPDTNLTMDSRTRRLFHATNPAGQVLAEALVRAGVARAIDEGRNATQLRSVQAEASASKRGCLWGSGGGIEPVQQAVRVETVVQAATSNLPGGFSEVVVTGGLNNPTAFVSLADGRILVAEKTGIVRVFKNGALLATPLIDIRTRVNDYWDRGLLGLAADPDFATNGFVYVLYAYENNAADYSGTKTSRLSRFTVSGDVASTATEAILLGRNVGTTCNTFPTGSDCLPGEGFSHNVGSIRFATDGTLFITNGDAASFSAVVDDALRSQNLDSLAGKLIHIDRDGNGLTGNPFWNGSATAARSKVWAYGLRNPYRFHLRPGSGAPYVGDVGWDVAEELDVAIAGANLGWPCYEGTGRQAGYSSKPTCQTLYNQGTAAVRAPLVSWDHSGGSAAATGGTFYTGTSYPAAYQGAYFYGDYSRSFIRSIRVDANDVLTSGPSDFAATADGPVDFGIGLDGDLYYLAINAGQLRRLRYAAPVAATNGFLSDQAWSSATNGWGPVERDRSNGEAAAGDGRTMSIGGVTFAKGLGVHALSDVRYTLATGCTRFTAQIGVDDEVGGGSIVFQVWADGVKAYESGALTGAMGATAVSVDLTGKSELRLMVTDAGNGIGEDHGDWADAKLTCGTPPAGTAPVATITAPSSSLTYKIGDVVSFSGSASDAEDGALPATALAWQIIIHHCPSGVCHNHPLQTATGANGTFTVPDHGDESHFELRLTATDSAGMTGTASVHIHPQTVQITLASNPAGLQLVRGGTAFTAPKVFTSIIGSTHTITATTPQTMNGTQYDFSAWSDGGAAQHAITVGASAATYTATYIAAAPTAPAAPSNLTASSGGSAKNVSITLRWTDNSTNEAKFVIERSTSSAFTTNLVTVEVPANTLTYSSKGLANRTTYFYRVYAVTAAGQQSARSNTASATTK